MVLASLHFLVLTAELDSGNLVTLKKKKMVVTLLLLWATTNKGSLSVIVGVVIGVTKDIVFIPIKIGILIGKFGLPLMIIVQKF